MTTYLSLSTKMSNNKQKSIFVITDINNEYFRKLLKIYNNLPYLDCKSKQVHNEPTEYYFFLIKHITKLMKIKRRVQVHTNFVKSCIK